MLPTSCDPPDEVCCSDLISIAEHLRDELVEALNACIDDECNLIVGYATMGQGDDGVVNALTVEFDGAEPTAGSASGNTQLPIVIARSTFTVRLRESGWPTVTQEGSAAVPPQPSRQHVAAYHAFAHGELMYRTLLSMKASRSIVPSTVRGCLNVVIGPLQPLRPSGGVVGFTARVSVDLPWGA